MGGELRDIYSIKLREHLAMNHRGRGKLLLQGVGPHQKRAASARRVQDDIVRSSDAGGVDEVHDVGNRVVLAEAVSFGRAEKGLENGPDDVVVELREVEAVDLPDELPPAGGRVLA